MVTAKNTRDKIKDQQKAQSKKVLDSKIEQKRNKKPDHQNFHFCHLNQNTEVLKNNNNFSNQLNKNLGKWHLFKNEGMFRAGVPACSLLPPPPLEDGERNLKNRRIFVYTDIRFY